LLHALHKLHSAYVQNVKLFNVLIHFNTIKFVQFVQFFQVSVQIKTTIYRP